MIRATQLGTATDRPRVLDNIQFGILGPVAVVEIVDDVAYRELPPIARARRFAKRMQDAFPQWTVTLFPVDALDMAMACPVGEPLKGGVS